MSDNIMKLIVRLADLLPNVKFNDYKFFVHRHDDTVQLYAEYQEADTYTGVVEMQRTRRWNITPPMTDSEIVQTAFKCCLTSVEHRAREAFQYKGARIFGPHFDVEDLVELCKDRENAGGRRPLGGCP